MNPSKACWLQSLTSMIHPPLPMSPRESQQLLTMLTSSFRRQLDREHPPFQRDRADDATETERGRSREARIRQRQTQETDHNSSSQTSALIHADSHIQSILTNPLVSIVPRRRASSSPHQSIPVGSSGFDSARRIFKDPMGWFDEQFALGAATADLAAFCLDTHQKLLRSFPDTPIIKSMKASGAGSKVLRWINTTTITESNDFLAHGKLMSLLIPYLVTEERQGVIWNWLYHVPHLPCEDDPHSNQSRDPRLLLPRSGPNKSKILLQLIKAELVLGGGMDVALAHFLRCVKARETARDSNLRTGARKPQRSIFPGRTLLSAGQFLTSVLTSHPCAVTPDLFDHFCSSLDTWSTAPILCFADLQAHHPLKPDPTYALRYFRSLPGGLLPTRPIDRKRTITLLLDTSRLLLERGDIDNANWVMEYTGAGFAKDLGLLTTGSKETEPASRPTRPSKKQERLFNLQLLEGIELRYS